MPSSGPWYRIGTCIVISAVMLAGCSSASWMSYPQSTASIQHAGEPLASSNLSPASVQVTPNAAMDYPVPPDQLANNVLQGNYELIYSQTSDTFKSRVSWDAFLDTLQSFNRDVQHYTPQSSLQQDGKLRKIWIDKQHGKGIVAEFAEHHPDYPDHTILNMHMTVQNTK